MWDAEWYFPVGKDIRKESINNAAMEIFRDNPIYSLAREVCQNSLDAVDDKNQAVLVDFQIGTIESNRFPGKNYFIDVVLPRANDTWSSDETNSFLMKCKESLNRSQLPFLRISDFNTKGLQGANGKGETSPWKSLVEEVGSSIKYDDTSSGSFGIGKAAPFVCSGLRTVFYNTKIKDEGEYAIGVSNFVSFDLEDGFTAQGVGYFGNKKRPLEYNVSLDNEYKRENFGTDIYILDFNEVSGWEKQTILSIIENFLVSIYTEKLTVKVGNVEINKSNLGTLIRKIENSKSRLNIQNYYDALTNNLHLVFGLDDKFKQFGFNSDDATLYIIKMEGANRSVLMTRRAGMRIFEKKGISSSIQFTGVFHATGKAINKMLKIMENPAHEKWVPSRYSKDPRLAEKFILHLNKFIKKTIVDAFQEIITEEVDAYGLGDFLPDSTSSKGKNNKEKKNSEAIKTSLLINDPKSKSSSNLVTEEFILDHTKINPEQGDMGGLGSEATGERGGPSDIPPGGDGSGDGENQKGEGSEKVLETLNLRNIKGKYRAKIVENKGTYSLLFKPDVDINKGVIEILAVGEQNSIKLSIVSANHNSEDLRVYKNRIAVENIKKGSLCEINFILSLKVRMKLGVNIFEDK